MKAQLLDSLSPPSERRQTRFLAEVVVNEPAYVPWQSGLEPISVRYDQFWRKTNNIPIWPGVGTMAILLQGIYKGRYLRRVWSGLENRNEKQLVGRFLQAAFVGANNQSGCLMHCYPRFKHL